MKKYLTIPVIFLSLHFSGTGNNGCTCSMLVTRSVTICSFIRNESETKETIFIYPKPGHEYIPIETQIAGTLLLYNSLGQKILKQKTAGITTFDELSSFRSLCSKFHLFGWNEADEDCKK